MKKNNEIYYDVNEEQKLKLEKRISVLKEQIEEKKSERGDYKNCIGDYSSALDGDAIAYANDLGLLLSRLNRLLEIKSITRVLPADKIEEKISILDIVEVKYEDGDVERYKIVFGADEALETSVEEDGFYKTTLESRIGQSLYGKKIGDNIEGFIAGQIVDVEKMIENVNELESIEEVRTVGKKVR